MRRRCLTIGVLLLVAIGVHIQPAQAKWAIGNYNAYSTRLVCRDGMIFAAGNWDNSVTSILLFAYLSDTVLPLTPEIRFPLPYHNAPMLIFDEGYMAPYVAMRRYTINTLRWSDDLAPGTRVSLYTPNGQRVSIAVVQSCYLGEVPLHTADVLWHNQTTGELWMHLMYGSTTIQSKGVGRVTDANWQLVSAADPTGDGQIDILWRHRTTGNLAVTVMNGSAVAVSTGLFRAEDQSTLLRVADANWEIVGTGDYSGDGEADLLWRHRNSQALWVDLLNSWEIWFDHWLYLQGSPTTPVVLNSGWVIIGAGDFTLDGTDDILVRNTSTGAIAFLWMEGPLIHAQIGLNPSPDLGWELKGTGDYDGNEFEDMLWRNRYTGQLMLYLLYESEFLIVDLDQVEDLGWHIVGSDDYNDDGMADIFWRHASSGYDAMWFMEGPYIVEIANTTRVISQQWQVASAASLIRDGSSASGNAASASEDQTSLPQPNAKPRYLSTGGTLSTEADISAVAQPTDSSITPSAVTSPLLPVTGPFALPVNTALSGEITPPERAELTLVFVPVVQD